MFLMGVWSFFKKISFEVWVVIAIVGAAFGIGLYIDREAVKRTQRKQETDALRETVVLQGTAREVTNEIERRVEGVDEALARLPQFASADELRKREPELAEIILRDPARDER